MTEQEEQLTNIWVHTRQPGARLTGRPHEVTLALDWTPNAYHAGFYVAKERGYYSEENIELTILPADSPKFSSSGFKAAQLVVDGQADYAIGTSEDTLEIWAHSERRAVRAVAALTSMDTSALVTLASDGKLCHPRLLDGCRYGRYTARGHGQAIETAMVADMIRADGGQGIFTEIIPHPATAIWDRLVSREIDAAWVYLGWEGVRANLEHLPIFYFRPSDYGVPYGYSPVLMADRDLLLQHSDDVRAFVKATARGYKYAMDNPAEAARAILKGSQHPTLTPENLDLLEQSQRYLNGAALSSSSHPWGYMDPQRWSSFVNYLTQKELLRRPTGEPVRSEDVKADQIFTNEFLYDIGTGNPASGSSS